MNSPMMVDVAVIGGGPAGLAAALECHKNGIASIAIFDRDKELGGILQQCIHNGFGLARFKEELTGPEYAERFIRELDGTGIRVFTDTMVLSVDSSKRIMAMNPQEGLFCVAAKAIILAMGCRERSRGALGIPGNRPAGVFTAGCAQRLVNMEGYIPGREVVILGSGDIGLIMARRLTWEGVKVKLVCEILPTPSGLMRNVVQCLEDNGIPLKVSHTVAQIHGQERVEGVTVAQVDENRVPIPETFEYIPCDTLLLSVGLIPENELSDEIGIAMDPITGGAAVDQYRQTSMAGVFSCGNVLHVHDLVDNVSEEAEIAGRGASAYVQGKLSANAMQVQVRPGPGVRYVAPQRITLGDSQEPIKLYFRVKSAAKPAQLQVTMGDEVLAKRKAVAMLPGEMETVKIQGSSLQSGQNLEILVTVIGEGV